MEQILKNKKIDFIKEYEIKELNERYKIPFRFDFCIKSNKNEPIILIEIQGEQHYKSIPFFGGEEKFLRRKKYDNIKRNYCKENNIKLIEIPYWDWSNMEVYLEGI